MTSAFVPFQSDTLPSPPTYFQPFPTPTKLPSLLSDPRTRYHPPKDDFFKSTCSFFSSSSSSFTNNTMGNHYTNNSSLPSVHELLSPPPLPPPQLSPPSEDEEFPSRKGSIASILNSAPELRQLDEEEFRNGYQSHFNEEEDTDSSSSSSSSSPPLISLNTPLSLKRGRPRVMDHHPPLLNSSHHQQQQLQVSKKRKCHEQPPPPSPPEPIPRANKGLRHFSKQVCDKVAEKGVTTYNEVADELALDIRASMENEGNDRSFDQKNIRRRVYDALNVLMAMNIITKDKKQIKWLGIPTCFQEDDNNNTHSPNRHHDLQKQVDQEQRRNAQLKSSIHRTQGLIRDKLAQHLQLCNLVWRNYHTQHNNNHTIQNDTEIIPPTPEDENKISLPFFIVACPTKQDLTVQVAPDR
ncbi:E2F/DP family winged-helix DNA-binding domain-containing protein [Phascolomyces articulosus]|uniref:E2F/DP family winged-helix DNA-binding domain-containing protein n=1 Tax=Phascolomyces articulosus TaxID=60185 RepID=A0AAD5P7H7_9FUNG|nr:E2F/DP family winged-helix DNA-binding domain-containing protein [Phascolomyces articulosus]